MSPLAAQFACYGEILWDCLPAGIFLGGAPLNVAYHLQCQGANVAMFSAVGRDFLGQEALRRIDSWGVDVSKIQRQRQDTGRVIAELDPMGSAHYTIEPFSAWDFISVDAPALERRPPRAIVFGTLALRQKRNRRALEEIFCACPTTLRVLDLNLRNPYDSSEVVSWALSRAQWLKLNEEELRRIAGPKKGRRFSLETAAREVADHYGLEEVCVTAGRRGAGLWREGEWYWENARSISVVDTIGAGDAFLGALLAGQIYRGEEAPAALEHACRLAEYVASRSGATPAYRLDTRGRVRVE